MHIVAKILNHILLSLTYFYGLIYGKSAIVVSVFSTGASDDRGYIVSSSGCQYTDTCSIHYNGITSFKNNLLVFKHYKKSNNFCTQILDEFSCM